MEKPTVTFRVINRICDEPPYVGCAIYGPYPHGQDGRLVVQILSPDGKRKTTTYARYQMEIHLGLVLTENLEVHHKDENIFNEQLSNYEILTCEDHSSKHHKTSTENFNCAYCNQKFTKSGNSLAMWKQNKAKGHNGPFCSLSCSTKFRYRRNKDAK